MGIVGPADWGLGVSLGPLHSHRARRPRRRGAVSGRGESRLGNPPCWLPRPSLYASEAGGGERGGAKERARQAPGGARPGSAGAKKPRTRLVCSRRDLQGARWRT